MYTSNNTHIILLPSPHIFPSTPPHYYKPLPTESVLENTILDFSLNFFIVVQLPKVPSQCYSNGPHNLGILDWNKEVQPLYTTFTPHHSLFLFSPLRELNKYLSRLNLLHMYMFCKHVIDEQSNISDSFLLVTSLLGCISVLLPRLPNPFEKH